RHTRSKRDWSSDVCSSDLVYEDFKHKIEAHGNHENETWDKLFSEYEQAYPDLAAELKQAISGELAENYAEALPVYEAGKDKLATRASSGEVLNAIANAVPTFFGGSADLAGSNKTTIKNAEDFTRENYA